EDDRGQVDALHPGALHLQGGDGGHDRPRGGSEGWADRRKEGGPDGPARARAPVLQRDRQEGRPAGQGADRDGEGARAARGRRGGSEEDEALVSMRRRRVAPEAARAWMLLVREDGD